MFHLSLKLALTVFFSASLAFSGGSRVGNGNDGGGDKKSSFELAESAELPPGFLKQFNSNGDLILKGPAKTTMLSLTHLGQPMQIRLQDLKTRYPQLKDFSHAQWLKWFETNSWKKLNPESSDCPKLQVIQNKDHGTLVLAWSQTDGIAITYDNVDTTRKATKKLVGSLQNLNEKRECSWK